MRNAESEERVVFACQPREYPGRDLLSQAGTSASNPLLFNQTNDSGIVDESPSPVKKTLVLGTSSPGQGWYAPRQPACDS
jgi:hypothetical protein